MFSFLKKSTSHPRDKEVIEIFDSTGSRLQIPFKEWRTKYLPENIEASWNNADALAKWVLGGLRDGLSSDVDKASKHLMEIDDNAERAVCFRANVLMDLKKYKEMEGAIINYLSNHPKTGVVLSNLAKAQNFLKKEKEFLITLEEALKLDPNQENGLLWWASLYSESERKGLDISDDSAYLMGITEAEKRFGGWQVKQYLGSFFANKRKKEVAIHWFEKALQEKGWRHELLTAITGDLGQNGFIEDALKIVEPLYQPDRDNFFTGVNLLQSYLELNKIDKGQELLDKMFAIRDVGMEEKLLWYQSKFNDIRGKKKVVPEEEAYDGIGFSSIDSPLWAIGTGGKKTGFEIEKTGKKIALIQFYQKLGEVKEASVTNEDDSGRFSRAILLYLLETMYYGSDSCSSFIFPTAKNGNYVLLSGDLSIDEFANLAKDGNYDGVLTGQFSSTKNELTLLYFDSAQNSSESKVIEFDFSCPEKHVSKIEKFLFDISGVKIDSTFNITNKGFKKIQDETLKGYLTGLSQRLTIALAGSNKSDQTMYGERNMIRWIIEEANYYSEVMQCQIGMLSAIRQMINYNSSAAKDYKKEIKSWLQNCAVKNPQLQDLSTEVMDEFNEWLND